MTTGDTIIDAAIIGTIVSSGLQLIRLLPARWLQKIFTDNKETQAVRMRAGVFVTTLAAVIAQSAQNGTLSHWENVNDLLGTAAIALTTAYSVYQSALRMLSDKFPEYFSVSE